MPAVIYWGTRYARRAVGRWAGFCSICRRPRRFIIERTKLIRHLQYFIPLSRGTVVGYHRRCSSCGTRTPVTASITARMASRWIPRSLTGLIAKTNPSLLEDLATRLALEERVAQQSLGAEERRKLILEPFVDLNPMLRSALGDQWIMDLRVVGLILLAVFGTILLAALISVYWDEEWGQLFVYPIVIFVLAGGFGHDWLSRWLLAGRLRRNLARCLSPLRVTREELGVAYAACEGMELEITRYVQEEKLWKSLR